MKVEITITEALAEIKTIKARITQKRNSLGNYIARDARVLDPFHSQGGSEKFVKAERQSIADLETRMVNIRTEIQVTNLREKLTINDRTMSVAEWLTWRREVADGQASFLQQVIAGIKKFRDDIQKKGGKVVQASAVAEVNFDQSAPPTMVLSVDEQEILKQADDITNILGTLDGKLSLFNATVKITV